MGVILTTYDTWDDPPSRDPITETENGFMEPKGPMRFGGDCTP